MSIVYLDTETTGFNPGQICEISIIKEDNNQNIECAKNYFFSIDHIDDSAAAVNGFTTESLIQLSNGSKFCDKCDQIYSLLSDSIIVAHNESFDEKFISAEMWRCGVSFMPAGRQDTMGYFRDIVMIPSKREGSNSKYKNPKLSEVAEYYRVDFDKVGQLCMKLFDCDNESLHDSRFDTTLMYVEVQIRREELSNVSNNWRSTFCK